MQNIKKKIIRHITWLVFQECLFFQTNIKNIKGKNFEFEVCDFYNKDASTCIKKRMLLFKRKYKDTPLFGYFNIEVICFEEKITKNTHMDFVGMVFTLKQEYQDKLDEIYALLKLSGNI